MSSSTLEDSGFDYTTRKHISKLVPKSHVGLILITMLTAVVYPTATGMESSIIGTINSLQQYKDYFGINNKTLGLNSAAAWIGYFLSTPFIQQVCDRFGRKKTIYGGIVVMYIGIALTSAAQNTAMFVIGRIILGLSGGILGAAANCLIGELSPPTLRGFIVGIYHSCYYVGALIASGVTFGTSHRQDQWSWRIPTLVQIIPATMCLIMLFFTPESPRWLVLKGKEEEAKELLYILNNKDVKSTEMAFADIKRDVVFEATHTDAGVYKRQFIGKANLRRLAIMFSLAVCCELCGNSIATYYFSILLDSAGVTNVTTQLQVAIIKNSFCFVCALVGCYTFDIIGRKKQALISISGIIITLYILGALVKVYANSDNNGGKYGAIAMMFLFSGSYSFCFTPLLSVYPVEIFSNASRLAGVTLFSVFDYSCGIISTFILPIGISNLGYKFYIVNASYDLILVPIIYFVWVETKNMSLEDIPTLFGEPRVIEISESTMDDGSMTKSNVKVETLDV